MSRRVVNGFLLLDKPATLSSNNALQTVKRLYHAKKAGHAGTLDPIATGMLLVCFGQYTKFAQFLLDTDKRYTVTAKMGERTETADTEGEVIETRPIVGITPERFEQELANFRGETMQIPSMYSALKHEGQPLYKLARQGITVERKPRKIHIFHLSCTDLTADTFTLEVHCSKGTYIRNLVEDIGEALGCGAHMTQLRRTTIGPFQAAQMNSMSSLEALHDSKDWSAMDQRLLSLDAMNTLYDQLELTDNMAFYLQQGQAVQVPNAPTSGLVVLKHQAGEFLGIGHILPDGKVAPKRLVSSS